ncbi:MAG: DUF3332 domain-containing protein [Bacteroidales bacterium]|jgi:hypothetical protein|nr:DUF3332 domain-containing protein [Bacteroidales bacterium]NCU36840.1 DUF3332 family protein [Candidatus Falkowbacteria bacterium]MDD2632164.1 DUF3332 domain-containing protein [Bacteroidales bacterium]MDD3132013.1 DUF3332 domain-containing protein [Bacteroidales bacterium]MDD4175769.1 DUF3332 domain-containing protein [Bacteroidales bacterium]
MKKLKALLLAVILLGTAVTHQSCIGSFQLTRNLYSWNMDIDGRWGSELVFLAMIIIPVYTVTLLADGVVLNAIEFWTGNNPLAMNAVEKQTRIVKKDGDSYRLTAEKNTIHVQKLSGDNTGETGEFLWNEQGQNWIFQTNDQRFVLQQ